METMHAHTIKGDLGADGGVGGQLHSLGVTLALRSITLPSTDTDSPTRSHARETALPSHTIIIRVNPIHYNNAGKALSLARVETARSCAGHHPRGNRG
jgi:hypothetical protein